MEPRPFGSLLLGAPDQSARALRVRVQTLLTVLLVSTNVVGALVVVALTVLVMPRPTPSHETLVAAAIAVPAYVVLAVLIGVGVGTSTALHSLRWATEDRTPTEDERRAALRVPWRLTLLQASLWTGGVVVFTVLAAVLQPDLAVTVFLTVGIASAMVCAIAYLFSEFALRPISARALTGRERLDAPSGVGRRMVLFWSLGSGVPVAGIVAVAILSLTRGNVSLTKLAVIMLVLGGVVLVFGLLVTVLNARAVVAPIESVRTALHRVDEGDLDVEVPVYDGTQLGLLQAGFNAMVSGLRDRERIRDLFGMHVGHEVAQAAVQADTELGGETRTVTVLFTDLIGSTEMAIDTPPAEVVDLLNRFCSVVVEEVDQRRGLVNKFMGDAVLAIFGAPVDLEDHAGSALAAARAVARRLRTEVPECDAGIGVATGEVVAGNVGGEQRFEYTVIGDAVNQAARLTELAKEQPGRVVASAESVRAAGDEESAHWRESGAVVLRGRDEETVTCVLAEQGS